MSHLQCALCGWDGGLQLVGSSLRAIGRRLRILHRPQDRSQTFLQHQNHQLADAWMVECSTQREHAALGTTQSAQLVSLETHQTLAFCSAAGSSSWLSDCRRMYIGSNFRSAVSCCLEEWRKRKEVVTQRGETIQSGTL